MIFSKEVAECAREIRDIHQDKETDDSQETDPLSATKDSFTGSNVAVEAALI